LWVFPAAYLPRYFSRKIRERDPYPSWRNVAVIGWTGMRGMVSLAAALALPLNTDSGLPFPGRSLILFLTFTVILATLVVQGLTLPALIRWLGVEDDHSVEREERLARLKANQAALKHLEETIRSGSVEPRIGERLRAEYEDRISQLESSERGNLNGGLFSTDYDGLAHQALRVERNTILDLRNERVINDEVLRRIQHDIDLAEARLSRQKNP
jgi:CPA1 family monovalent cation:H+ antiporter